MMRTADFDLVLEIAGSELLRMATAKPLGRSPDSRPPFEVEFPTPVGTVHWIVRSLNLLIAPDGLRDFIRIILEFDSGSVGTIAPLEGAVIITAPLRLREPDHTLILDFEAAEVGLTLSGDSSARLGALADGARDLVDVWVRRQGALAFMRFDVQPGVDGTLPTATGPARFEHLEAHTIGRAAVGLFANLYVDHRGRGDATLMTSSRTGHGLAMVLSIDRDTFHRSIFCPAIASTVARGEPVELPKSCGAAPGLPMRDGTLLSVTDELDPGVILIEALMQKEGTCYTAQTRLRILLGLDATTGAVRPQVRVLPPETSVDVPWYCELFSFGFIDFFVSVFAFLAADAIGTRLADALGRMMLGALQEGVGQLTAGVLLHDVDIDMDGITLGVVSAIPTPEPRVEQLRLSSSKIVEGLRMLPPRVHRSACAEFCELCPPRDFLLTEVLQDERANIVATPTLLGRPIVYRWFIGSTELTEPEGTLDLLVTAQYPTPPGSGTVVHDSPVRLAYTVHDNIVTLSSTGPQGNFMVRLEVRASDPNGRSIHTSLDVAFNGTVFAASGELEEYLGACSERIQDFLRRQEPVLVRAPNVGDPVVSALLDRVLQLRGRGGVALDTLATLIRMDNGGLLPPVLVPRRDVIAFDRTSDPEMAPTPEPASVAPDQRVKEEA